MCEGSTIPINFPNIINFSVRATIYGVRCTPIAYMFSNAKNLLSFASSTGDRDSESDNNTIVASNCQQAFENCTQLSKIGPIINLGTINLSKINNDYNRNGYRMFYNCNALTDVRIKNLNGSYANFADNTEIGNIPNLDEDSIKYLFDNLTNLSVYNEDYCTDDINHNFTRAAESNSDVEVSISTLTFKKYKKSTSTDVSIQLNAKDLDADINVYNIEGKYVIDVLYENGDVQNTITEDGNYDLFGTNISHENNKYVHIRLRSLTANTDGDVTIQQPTITLVRPYNPSAPKASSAELHCPIEWEDKITAEMISNANAKKWSVIIEN